MMLVTELREVIEDSRISGLSFLWGADWTVTTPRLLGSGNWVLGKDLTSGGRPHEAPVQDQKIDMYLDLDCKLPCLFQSMIKLCCSPMENPKFLCFSSSLERSCTAYYLPWRLCSGSAQPSGDGVEILLAAGYMYVKKKPQKPTNHPKNTPIPINLVKAGICGLALQLQG